jgi:hypothetical protein
LGHAVGCFFLHPGSGGEHRGAHAQAGTGVPPVPVPDVVRGAVGECQQRECLFLLAPGARERAGGEIGD